MIKTIPQTQMRPADNVIQFDKVQRRKSIAHMSKGYAFAIAAALTKCKIVHRDDIDPQTGDPRALRDMDRTEIRHSAVVSAAIFFEALLDIRARFEKPGQERSTDDYGLYTFVHEAGFRRKHYERDRMGLGIQVLSEPGVRGQLERIERDYAHHVFTALKIESQNDPDLDEVQFWADIFRGFADGDSSGIVLRAAGLVLLDHLDAFSRALAFHR